MASFYSGLNTKVQNVIEKRGKPMTLARPARAPAVGKAWLTEQGPASAAAAQSIDVTAVLLGPTKADRLGTTSVESKTGRILVSTKVTLPERITTDWTIDDGSRKFEITSVEEVNPGPTILLYKLEVAL